MAAKVIEDFNENAGFSHVAASNIEQATGFEFTVFLAELRTGLGFIWPSSLYSPNKLDENAT